MALRSGYKGIKKLAAGLKWNRPGILAAITDYEVVSNSGLVFVFYRSGNVVTVNMSGESTSAFANNADIVTIPEKYRFYRADGINIISYEMVNSLVKLLLLSGSNIKANTPIAVGDKLRGSFSYITS